MHIVALESTLVSSPVIQIEIYRKYKHHDFLIMRIFDLYNSQKLSS